MPRCIAVEQRDLPAAEQYSFHLRRKLIVEKKDQQVKSMVYLSLHAWSRSFTDPFAGLAGKTTERRHPALLLFSATSPIHAFVIGCILADMQWTQLGNWHGSKLNFPLQISFQSHQYPDPDHFMAAITRADVGERKSENRHKSNGFLQRHQLISPHRVYETTAWSSIAQSCTTPYTVCDKH